MSSCDGINYHCYLHASHSEHEHSLGWLMLNVECGSVTGNPGFASLSSPSPPQSSNQTTSTNVGLIAGAAGGGVAALLLIVGLVVFCMCRKQPTKSGLGILPSSNPTAPHENGTGIFTSPTLEICMSFCLAESPIC